MFVSLKNEVYVTGYNDGGQLGLGHQKKVKIVKKIMGIEEQVIQLSGSSNYSVVRTASH
jgi:alpha-tubulin suppressor-like RCC1 family protein